MKKLLVLLISLMISFNSFGEWSFISQGKVDEYYVDFDKISKNNGYVYYWTLTNFPSPPYAEGKSSLEFYEVSCNPPIKQRRKAYYFYNSTMGKGKMSPVFDTSTGPWEYKIPGSIREKLLEAVC
jgi:hypothetical protein